MHDETVSKIPFRPVFQLHAGYTISVIIALFGADLVENSSNFQSYVLALPSIKEGEKRLYRKRDIETAKTEVLFAAGWLWHVADMLKILQIFNHMAWRCAEKTLFFRLFLDWRL